jgi:hypothetical protein
VEAARVDGLDPRLGERAVGEDLELVAEEALRLAALRLDGDRRERRRDLLAPSASISRPSGVGVTSAASFKRRFVSPAMALTMTTTWWPAACVAMARAATLLIRSIDPTDVPPNFWTMRANAPRQLLARMDRVK